MPLTRRTILGTAAALLTAPLAPAPTAHAQMRPTLNIGVVSDPVTLDPAFSASFFETQILYNLHDTLLVVRPDGTVAPGLASLEMLDPLHYRLSLRDGLIFQDGTPLDAAAVKANIDRFMDPAIGSVRRAEFGPLTDVAVRSPTVVELTLAAPYAPLPLMLANRAGMMVSPTAVVKLGPDFASKAVGAGPWRLVSWTKDSELVLEAFPGYWQGPPDNFARLVYRPLPDETVRLAELRKAALQLIDGVPPQAIPALVTERGVTVKQSPSLGFTAFAFNCTRAPFASRRVRRAFTAAIDPAVVQHAVYSDTGRIAHGPLSPALPWAFDPGHRGIPFDPAHAKSMLARTRSGQAVLATITVTNSPQMIRTAQLLQAQADAAGFRVSIRQVEPTNLIDVLRARDFDLCLAPWSGRYDPDGNMFSHFTKSGSNNFSGYEDREVESLLEQARSETDRAVRAALYRQAQAKLTADAPMLFLHFDAVLQASSANLTWTQYPDAAFRLFDAALA